MLRPPFYRKRGQVTGGLRDERAFGSVIAASSVQSPVTFLPLSGAAVIYRCFPWKNSIISHRPRDERKTAINRRTPKVDGLYAVIGANGGLSHRQVLSEYGRSALPSSGCRVRSPEAKQLADQLEGVPAKPDVSRSPREGGHAALGLQAAYQRAQRHRMTRIARDLHHGGQDARSG